MPTQPVLNDQLFTDLQTHIDAHIGAVHESLITPEEQAVIGRLLADIAWGNHNPVVKKYKRNLPDWW